VTFLFDLVAEYRRSGLLGEGEGNWSALAVAFLEPTERFFGVAVGG
jgi:hypothetical protein